MLACVLISMALMLPDQLPDLLSPIYPTYIKYFACQTLVFLAAVVGIAWLLGHKIEGQGTGWQVTLRFSFPLLLLTYILWAFMGYYRSPWPAGARTYLLRESTFFALAVVAFLIFQKRQHCMTFARVFFGSVCAAAILQMMYMSWFISASGFTVSLREALWRKPVFGNVNYGCATLVTGVLLAAALGLRRARSVRRREGSILSVDGLCSVAGYGAAAAALVGLLYLSYSLAGYIAAAAGVAVFLLCVLPLPRKSLIAGGAIIVMLLTGVIITSIPQYRRAVIRRLLKPGTTTRARVVWWTAAGGMWEEKPLAGWGTGAFMSTYYSFAPPLADDAPPTRGVITAHPHNEFLRIGSELGIIGLFLYCAMLLAAFVPSAVSFNREASDRRLVYFALWSGLIAYLVQAAFGKAITAWDMALPFWILMGAVASQTPGENVITTRTTEFNKSKWLILAVCGMTLGWGWWNMGLQSYRSMLAVGDVHHAITDIFKRGREAQERAETEQFEAGDELDEAAEKLRRWQHACLRPDRVLALHYSLAKLYFAEGKYRRALKHFNWCHRAAPGMLRSDYYRARIHQKQGDERQAQRCFQQYLDLHPGDTRAYVHLLRYAPERTLRRLIEQVVQRDRLANGKRVALVGRLLADMEKWKQLHEWFEKAKRQSSPQVYKDLGSAVSDFCGKTGQKEQIAKLKRHYPHAFRQGNNRNIDQSN